MPRSSGLRPLIAVVVMPIFVGSPVALVQDGKPDLEWNKDHAVPSAFPDIKPIREPKEVEEFAKKWTSAILDTDPLLLKLHKTKLRNALHSLVLDLQGRNEGPRIPPLEVIEWWLMRLTCAIHDAVRAGVDSAADEKERRLWLSFGVGVHKGLELAARSRADVGAIHQEVLMQVQRDRLDAEIALLRHDQRKK
jgi:hypothetical protein